ncbi:hypothetical protein PFICI_00699 [Pestalotiopsis fici W106-1]|uniref:Fringe-like glycosyltransferase domain-containing protein n=1 Tax=Pestalotiopsis fici (strain W106-1 / CGMCC3.15140) TaxID=1229662 RepID=W3XNN4_PESFW|nr:uncharacterized protein PFICI_00699 [Pestalotiopsis fici W106-1]ETS86871.1 hypothetical protein PFICI_00699 [Pestalotiopsis fici W106-1]
MTLPGVSALNALSSAGAQRRWARVTGVFFLTLVIWQLFLSSRADTSLLPPARQRVFKDDGAALGFVRRANARASLELSDSIKYTRRCIKPTTDTVSQRRTVVDSPEPLLDQPRLVNLQDSGKMDQVLGECVPISLSVSDAYPKQEKFSHLIFGMATTYGRLRDSLESIAHWSSGRDSKLIVIVQDWVDNVYQVIQLHKTYRERGVHAIFIEPIDKSHTTSQSHFAVLTKMVQESDPETSWFGLLDDDTFYPHLKPLSDALGALDHTKDLFVGTLSEDFIAVRNFGIQAYGGAGAYMSANLARKLGHPEQANQCLQEFTPDFGDIIIRDCVFHHSNARLTTLPGLYQHDLLGDMRGFFESGVEPINLHHWKNWYQAPVVAMSAATEFCGSCFLQRWLFGSNTLLSNGFSITLYPDGLDSIDLNKMERTWNQVYPDEDPHYEWVLGALRESVPNDQRISYFLRDTEVYNGTMRQLYLRERIEDSDLADEVIELIWRR